MKNRIASLLLVFALLLSLCGNAVARDNRIVIQSGGAERFTDVPTSHWAYSYINKVVGSGLFNGMTPTTFAPSNAMTRAQFVIVMSRMEGLEVERVETVTKFPDVPSNYWAAGAVAWATEAGIVGGFGDGTFKPTSPITRGQFAALIHRYIVSKRYVNLHVVDPEPAQFTDAASVSSAFTNDVEYARVHGLLTGYSDGTVRASNPITRAAIAAILARFLDLVQESGYTPLLDGPVIDGGDSGDSGTTPVDTPTNYDAIKMSVLAGTHGTTAIASVLRNGQQVASDDVQAGDRVTITHKPESGYVASVRVRDANGKVVTVHKTDANTSWFEMPAAMPVTVTVTYSKESSGGGGGGGSGSTPSSSVTQNYFLNVTSNVTGNGTVQFIRKDVSSLESLEGQELEDSLKSWYQDATTFTFSVVLKPATSLKGDPSVTNATKVYEQPTTFGDSVVYVYRATNTTPDSQTSTNALNVVVTANFIGGTTPANEWTLKANVSGGYVAIDTEASNFTADAVTNGGEKTAEGSAAKGKKLYVAFTRDDDSMGNPIVTPSTLPNPTITNPQAGSTGSPLWVYEVSEDVTTVSASFKPINKVGATYGITVNATADGNPEDLPTPKAQVSGSDATVAARGDTVTIVAPEIAGYGTGYHVKEVTVVDANSNTVACEAQADDADGNKVYTFTMPDSDVTVTVVYETNANEALSYKVNVTFDGSTGTGSLTLNIAGKDYPLSNAANGQQTVDLTADNVTIPEKQSDYVTLYGDKEWADTTTFALPMYLASQPVASSDSLYNKITKDTNNLETSSKESTVDLVNKETAELNVQFDKMQSYGYKLTVIGKGSVSGGSMAGRDMSGVSINKSIALNNSDGKPQTTTSGSVVMQSAPTITIPTPTTSVDGWALDSVQATYADGTEIPNAQSALNNGFTPTQPGIVNIVVSFYDTNANPVGFNVTVKGTGTGSVNLKAENGVVLAGTFTDVDTAKNALTAERSKTNRQTTANPAEGYYYAASGTIITLTPASDSVKIQSIVIDGDNKIGDEMTTEGFSYTLPDVQPKTIDIVVTLASFDSYTFTFQAPYGGALSATADFHSQSQGIKSETLDTILYSLNDAFTDDGTGHSKVLSGFKSGESGLDNNYGSTGAHLTHAIVYYLTKATKVNDKTNKEETGQQQLENKLNEIVETQVKENLNDIIKNQKNDMLSGSKRTDIETKIDKALDAALVNPAPYSANITDETSVASIVQKIYEKAPTTYSNDIRDYEVTATVTPVLTDAQMVGLDSSKVKTIKGQLKSFIMDYLSNSLEIAPVSANTAKANVNTVDTDNGTVRVSVEATLNNQPEVSSSFVNLYKDKLVIWLRSEISVTYKKNTTNTTVDLGDDVLDAFPITQVALSADDEAKVNSDLTGQLGVVDDTVKTEWGNALSNVMNTNTNAVYVSMGSILTKDMLDSVVEGSKDDDKDSALKTAIEKITEKIKSVGDGTNTETAFMNIYRDFVVFNKGQSDSIKSALEDKGQYDLITLKSKDGDTTSTVLGRIVPNSKYDGENAKGDCLELLLDFDSILADKNADNNAPFEKLVNLMVAFRDGFATDIRLNAENSKNEATKGQTAESVISGLLLNQISRSGVELTANKWGTVVSTKNGVGDRVMNATEKKEICDLAAKLLMTPLTEKLDVAWKDFEKQGYQSVSIALNVDGGKRTSLQQLVESLNSDLTGSKGKTDITVGVSVEEVLK